MCRINADEIAGIKFLALRGDATIREVKLAWARDRVSMSAVPMSLLASPFLADGRELPINMKENPRWHAILQPSEVWHLACYRIQLPAGLQFPTASMLARYDQHSPSLLVAICGRQNSMPSSSGAMVAMPTKLLTPSPRVEFPTCAAMRRTTVMRIRSWPGA